MEVGMKYMAYVFCCLMLLLSGCADRNQGKVPSFAMVQDEQGVALPHPDAVEDKNKGNIITVFTVIIPPEFIVETRGDLRAAYPLVGGHMNDPQAKIEDGFCFVQSTKALSKNPWGLIPGTCTIMGSKKQFTQYRWIITNQDGGVWAVSPTATAMVDDKGWDFVKFENDFTHRTEVLTKVGDTLAEINEFWKERYRELGQVPKNDVYEIVIDPKNPKWQAYREKLIKEMGFEIALPNGQPVVSTVDRDRMVEILAEVPRVTKWQKMVSHLGVSIGTPEVMAVSAASSILNGGIAALFDNQLYTNTARGLAQRRDLAPQMRFWYNQVQQARRNGQ